MQDFSSPGRSAKSSKSQIIDRYIEVPIEKIVIKEVEKIVQVPVEMVKIQTVEKIKEVVVDKIEYVDRIVEKEAPPKIEYREVPVYVDKIVEVEKIVEVSKVVEVEKIVEKPVI